MELEVGINVLGDEKKVSSTLKVNYYWTDERINFKAPLSLTFRQKGTIFAPFL